MKVQSRNPSKNAAGLRRYGSLPLLAFPSMLLPSSCPFLRPHLPLLFVFVGEVVIGLGLMEITSAKHYN